MASLRKILGDRIMEKMRNDDIRKALNHNETIMQRVLVRQHQGLGHVLRMEKNMIANMTLNERLDEKTKSGRPKTTWESAAFSRYDEGPKILTWAAQDRNRWRLLSNHVRAHVDVP
ncbi:hypothetical protein DPMN_000695 [Dreissena polymorpha]|uniref:Uncharacterized protein n=1 Tax=Dreissena polymorpha TaxID=45954 RepID=A0A9D4MIR3_DREPO|nr:hypothetical protein DPMN_000695 [Dreissena polymorpha]